jgi:hypothetical protein
MQVWQHDSDTEDLRTMSADVIGTRASAPAARSARDAARALCGLVGWLTRTSSLPKVQTALAELARYAPAWDAAAPLRALPVVNGRVNDVVMCVAATTSTLVPFFGAAALRSAMAFWAVESDPSVWQSVAAA